MFKEERMIAMGLSSSPSEGGGDDKTESNAPATGWGMLQDAIDEARQQSVSPESLALARFNESTRELGADLEANRAIRLKADEQMRAHIQEHGHYIIRTAAEASRRAVQSPSVENTAALNEANRNYNFLNRYTRNFLEKDSVVKAQEERLSFLQNDAVPMESKLNMMDQPIRVGRVSNTDVSDFLGRFTG